MVYAYPANYNAAICNLPKQADESRFFIKLYIYIARAKFSYDFDQINRVILIGVNIWRASPVTYRRNLCTRRKKSSRMRLARSVLPLRTILGALFPSWSIAQDDVLVLRFSRRCFSPLSPDDVNRGTFVSEDEIARKSSRWRVLSCEMLLNAGFIVADGRCHCKPVDTGVQRGVWGS